MDSQGNLYVADGGNHSLRKIVIVWPLVITPELVVRELPGDYEPGTALVVTLEAKPPSHTTSYAAQDQPPAGWTVSSISDGGSFDRVNGLVEFGPFLDSQPRTLTYVVLPRPAGQAPSNSLVRSPLTEKKAPSVATLIRTSAAFNPLFRD